MFCVSLVYLFDALPLADAAAEEDVVVGGRVGHPGLTRVHVILRGHTTPPTQIIMFTSEGCGSITHVPCEPGASVLSFSKPVGEHDREAARGAGLDPPLPHVPRSDHERVTAIMNAPQRS